jgi:tricorn protease
MNYRLVTCVALLIAVCPAYAGDEARLLRFPAIHGDQVVFTYASDLYTVDAAGGTARKLTNHEGFEIFARFAPDGESIAFTGQYDGNTEVYLMPSQGGVPKRLTVTPTLSRDDVSDRMGPNNIVMAWSPDGQRVIFRSRMRSFNSFHGRLYAVSAAGGAFEELPLPRSGFCALSPDGKHLAFNRVFREFRTWKRYRGGMADDIWVYDFQSKETVNITEHPAQDIIPMWKDHKIFFLSDRDEHKRMNLFVYDRQTQETRRLTDFHRFDIKFPSMGQQALVFENGGYIYRFDLATEAYKKIPIALHEDLEGGRSALVSVSDKISSYEIAPDGKRALLGARGDVFTVPAQHGPTRNLTQRPGSHERNATWSPDARLIAYISDVSGEDEIYVQAQDGSTPAQQVTRGADTYKYRPVWSPDSKKILWADRRQRLRYVSLGTHTITEVEQSDQWEFRAYAWSPDSQWIAYVKPEQVSMSKICLYSLEQDKAYELTDGWYEASDPVFSSDGKYLFFVSNRDFNPIYSSTEWNHAYRDMSRIYLMTLAKSTPSPFQPQSDEVAMPADDASAQPDTSESNEKDKPTPALETVQVDIDGIKGRIAVLPIDVSRYSRLRSVGDSLYYSRNGSKDDKRQLLLYDLKMQKETDLGAIGGYEISADHKKMLVSSAGKYAIIDLPKAKIDMKESLDLSEMDMRLDRRAEWTQIFNECWRQMREFFYVPNLHGVDWEAMRERYAPLVAHVNHRADLTYVIGEMISELNVGHTYVGGGEYDKPQRIPLGLLGAELELDPAAGYVRIKRILRGQNWDKGIRSPLTEIGVDANEGDYILAIDGRPCTEVNGIHEQLINKAGRQVTLTLNDQAQDKGSRKVVVVPTDSQEQLYYYDWVQTNIQTVAAATDNKVGYIHVPDMGRHGLNEFVKHYYPQIRKQALIIDVRGNGGGNVSPMLIERLRREVVMITVARNAAPSTNPGAALYGPMVCLADEFSASDGDLFTYRFKQHKLGKVIGKRTWGGVVGIRGSLPLLDGGTLNKPEFSRYDLAGQEWIIEGKGVDPDIYVDNDPAQEYAGIDQQLNRGIQVILEELETQEKTIAPVPPYPIR